jgi:hypothetical protein
MATKFVQAAGGCANAKDPDTENVDLGKMLVKRSPLSCALVRSAGVLKRELNGTARYRYRLYRPLRQEWR